MVSELVISNFLFYAFIITLCMTYWSYRLICKLLDHFMNIHRVTTYSNIFSRYESFITGVGTMIFDNLQTINNHLFMYDSFISISDCLLNCVYNLSSVCDQNIFNQIMNWISNSVSINFMTNSSPVASPIVVHPSCEKN